MTFEGQYLSYAEYQNLGGSAIGLMPFNLLEFESRKQIDLRTFNRLVGKSEIPQEVKLCDYRLINELQGYIKETQTIARNGSIASESIDGYSVSYATLGNISEIIKSKKQDIDDIVRTYLLNVVYENEHLMYAGVD